MGPFLVTWTIENVHFARFYKGSTGTFWYRLNVDFPMVIHGFREIVSQTAVESSGNTVPRVICCNKR